MVYHINIPLATDLISDSQQDLFDNTNQSNTSFGIDHVAFADVSGNTGKHTALHVVEQTAGPAVPGATAANEYLIYTLLNGGREELVIKPPGSVAGPNGQILTGWVTRVATGAEMPILGQFSLKCGVAPVVAGVPTTITLTTIGLHNFTTAIYYAAASFIDTAASPTAQCAISVTLTDVTLRWNRSVGAGTKNLGWIVIGV